MSYAVVTLGSLEGEAKVREAEGERYLSSEEEHGLLRLARHVLERFVRDGTEEYPEKDLAEFGIAGALRKEYGVFVTLTEHGQLRGCIGHIVPREPLYRGVIENAMNAAARDPRFPPVGKGELKDIRIEISVMSPLRQVMDLKEIVVGRDGLVLVNGPNTGVFLPQVPVEQGWDKTTYLEELGRKAGLDRKAYRDRETVLHRFSAQVFHEQRK